MIKLEALRQAMASADSECDGSFADAFVAFLDISETCDLMRDSKPAKDAMIKAALTSPVQELLGEGATIQSLHMLRYPGAGFLHGGFFVGSTIGTFFYFEKDRQGVVALNDGSPLTHFARITLTPIPEGTVLVPGPKGKQ